MQGVLNLWDRCWFARIDARDLAFLRITMGVLLLVWHLFLTPDLWLLSSAGPNDQILLDSKWSQWRLDWLFGLTPDQLLLVHGVAFLLIVAYTLGFLTPIAGWLIVLWLANVWHLSPWTQNGGDRLLRILLFYMCLSPSWRAWSLDALWMRRLGWTVRDDAPITAVRLIQLQLVVMYTYTGIAKLAGHTWIDGTAIYYSWMDVSYARWPMLLEWLLSFWPVQVFGWLMSWATLVFEVGFLPLIAWRRTRVPTLIAGLLLHAGIWGTLSVGIFSWASVWGYPVFLDGGWAERWRRQALALWRRSRRESTAVASLLVLAGLPLLQGCAPGVWNRQTVDCSDVERLELEAESKRMSLRMGRAETLLEGDSGAEVEGCRAVLQGLYGSRVRNRAGGTELDLDEVRVADLGYSGDDLVLDGLRAEWGSCSESELGRGCDEGDGALIEIDRLTVPGGAVDNALQGVQILSDHSGELSFDDQGAVLRCAGCALEGTVASEEPVEILLDGLTGDAELCIDHATVVRVELVGEIDLGAKLELRLAAPVQDVEIDIFETIDPFALSIELVVAEPPDGGYDWEGVPGRDPDPAREGRIRLLAAPGTAAGDVETSVVAGLECEPGRPGWEE